MSLAAFDEAVQALLAKDSERALRVVEGDREIDRMQESINERVLHALTEYQALASDLREILVAGRIAADLERIGDHAKSIAKRVHLLKHPVAPELLFQLKRLYGRAYPLMEGVIDAYARRDQAQAEKMWLSDAELDDIYDRFFRALVVQLEQGVGVAAESTHLLFVAKSIERVGDHATNIAEEISFQVTGVPVTNPRPKGGASARIAR